jgi:hypothetical protein
MKYVRVHVNKIFDVNIKRSLSQEMLAKSCVLSASNRLNNVLISAFTCFPCTFRAGRPLRIAGGRPAARAWHSLTECMPRYVRAAAAAAAAWHCPAGGPVTLSRRRRRVSGWVRPRRPLT